VGRIQKVKKPRQPRAKKLARSPAEEVDVVGGSTPALAEHVLPSALAWPVEELELPAQAAQKVKKPRKSRAKKPAVRQEGEEVHEVTEVPQVPHAKRTMKPRVRKPRTKKAKVDGHIEENVQQTVVSANTNVVNVDFIQGTRVTNELGILLNPVNMSSLYACFA
jgi:hypothetical protein